MLLRTRRFLALTVAIGTILLGIIWMARGRDIIYWYAFGNSEEIPLSNAGGARPESYNIANHRLYYFIFLLALQLAAGGAAALLILVPRPHFRHRSWIYFAFLAIVLPASWYNYSQQEVVLRASTQAGLNLLLIFLTATTAFWLSRAPAQAPDAKVIKYLSFVLMLFAGVFVPSLFTLIWLLYFAGFLGGTQTKEITFGHITGTASIVSAVIAWLKYSRDLKQADSKNSSGLIVEQ